MEDVSDKNGHSAKGVGLSSEGLPPEPAASPAGAVDHKGPPMLALEAQEISRTIENKALIDGVSFEVMTGEILAVIGPSGSGKSSLLRLLNRLDEPTGGTVLLKQCDYRAIEPKALRRRVGMVMQSAFLFPGTVGSNVQFGPLQRGTSLQPPELDALLERVGLAGYADRDVINLSGGEAQRVSLARTLANHPEVLLLDEPTSALDDDNARAIEQLILELTRARQMASIIVTHNRAQAARIADRYVQIEHGRLAATGSAKDITHA